MAVPVMRLHPRHRYGHLSWRAAETVRWTMTARARCGETSTVIVKVYRRSVWLSVEPFYNSEAILDPEHVDNLINTLGQAGQEAREYKS